MHKVGSSWLTQFQRQNEDVLLKLRNCKNMFSSSNTNRTRPLFVNNGPYLFLAGAFFNQIWNQESGIKWLIPWKKYKKGYLLASELKRLCTLCCCQIYSLWNLFSIWSVSVIYFSELLVEVLLMEMEREEWLLRVNCSISLCCQLSYSYISVKEEATLTQNWKYFWV